MYKTLKDGPKRSRVLKCMIPSPLPVGFEAASVYVWNYQGSFNTFTHKPDAKWSDWRSPSVPSGSDLCPPKPSELFNVGPAKAPYHDPEELIAPPKPTVAEKNVAKETRRQQIASQGEATVTQLEAAEKSERLGLGPRAGTARECARSGRVGKDARRDIEKLNSNRIRTTHEGHITARSMRGSVSPTPEWALLASSLGKAMI